VHLSCGFVVAATFCLLSTKAVVEPPSDLH